MMRKIFIEDEFGAHLALDGSSGIFIKDTKGFGIEDGEAVKNLETGFFLGTGNMEEQAQISGTLVLLRDSFGGPYEKFRALVDFIYHTGSIKIAYCPYGEEVYLRDVTLAKLEKAEIEANGVLESKIVFAANTPWHLPYPLSLVVHASREGEYKRYNYRYDTRYGASATPDSVDFTASGHYPAELELRAAGPLSQPVLTLADAHTGELLGRVDLSEISIEEGETLFYSSRAGAPGVWRMQNGKKEDLAPGLKLDAAVRTFFGAPPETPVTATFRTANRRAAHATLHVYEYYKPR